MIAFSFARLAGSGKGRGFWGRTYLSSTSAPNQQQAGHSLCDLQCLHLQNGGHLSNPTEYSAVRRTGPAQAGTRGMEVVVAVVNRRVRGLRRSHITEGQRERDNCHCTYSGFRVWIVREGPLRKRPSKSTGDTKGQVVCGSTYVRDLIHSGEPRVSGSRVSGWDHGRCLEPSGEEGCTPV